MIRVRILIPILAVILLAAILIPVQPISAQTQTPAEALSLLEEVNAARVAKGLEPYKTNSILMTIAQSHAEQMSRTGFLSHYERSLAPYQRALEAGYPVAGNLSQGGLFAENLYSGAKLTPADVVAQWANDSRYASALFSADFEDAGAGVAVASDQVIYFVLDAGSALDDPAFWVTPTSTSDGVVFTSTPLEDGSIYHVVQAKEVLWSIALAYDLSVDALKSLNGLKDDEIFEGQKLLVFQPKPEEIKTATPGVTFTATFGIPTSTATQPIPPTITLTSTPQPVAPASSQSGRLVVGVIVLIAFFAAGIGAWLGRQRKPVSE